MKTTSIKVSIMFSIFVLGVVFPVSDSQTFLLTLTSAVLFFLSGLFIPFHIQYNSLSNRLIIRHPIWSDTLSHKMPLTYTHFFSFLFLSGGMGMLIGELIQTQAVNFIGIMLLALGIGMIGGNQLAIKDNKTKNEQILKSSTERYRFR